MDLAGKVAVVTGPTSGIGKEIARELARRGARVVLAARDIGKARAVAGEIGGSTGVVRLDLASLASVREGAREIAAAHPSIHLLVNNAGIHTAKQERTVDGHETTFQVNHLGHFLLTRELLPNLRAATPSRIVNVASEAHRYAGPLDLDRLQGRRAWSGLRSYMQSKLANILFTKELAERLRGSGVVVHAAHPGSVATGWARGKDSGVFRFATLLARPFLISPEEGARTPLAAALSPEAGADTGLYWVRGKPRRPTRHAQDAAAARRLWDLSDTLVAPQAG